MLALRERGLGSAWTSLHLQNEREVAELLGIPYERYSQAGLFPVAYTIGTDFKPATRPASGRVHPLERMVVTPPVTPGTETPPEYCRSHRLPDQLHHSNDRRFHECRECECDG